MFPLHIADSLAMYVVYFCFSRSQHFHTFTSGLPESLNLTGYRQVTSISGTRDESA